MEGERPREKRGHHGLDRRRGCSLVSGAGLHFSGETGKGKGSVPAPLEEKERGKRRRERGAGKRKRKEGELAGCSLSAVL